MVSQIKSDKEIAGLVHVLTHLDGGRLQSMPNGNGDLPSWRCFGDLASSRPAIDEDDGEGEGGGESSGGESSSRR